MGFYKLFKRKLFALGMGNFCLKKDVVAYSLQYYDYDKCELPFESFDKIMSIFPYEVMVFKTKNGFSFISLSLIKGWEYTKNKAEEVSEYLNEDYTSGMKQLVIRVSPKFTRKNHKIVSHKPYFLGFGKLTECETMVSINHLNLLYNQKLIPDWVYDYYCNNHQPKRFKINFFSYYTKYKKWWKNI